MVTTNQKYTIDSQKIKRKIQAYNKRKSSNYKRKNKKKK